MVRTVKVKIDADVTGGVANVKTFGGTIKDFGGELDRLGEKHKRSFNSLTTTTGLLGLGLTAAFGAVVKSAAEFDKQMSAVASVSNSSAAELDQLRQSALKAGKETVFSATQAAQAEEELSKAGISTADILGGALKGALSLASAGSLQLADAATIAAQAMNIFHLQGKDVGHIADVLAAGANKSAADVGQLGDALKQGGLVAAQTGLSLEDTVGVLSAFADRGLIASDAGTSLKSMLQQLQAPSQKSSDLMKQLGINAYDTSGQFVGVVKLAENLRTSLGGLTQAQRDSALAQIFGTDATRAASVLYNLGAQGVTDYTTAVNDQGAAAETARKKLNNLSGDVEGLRGSLETLAISSGSGANSGLRMLAQTATGAVNAFLALPAPVAESATILAGVSGVTLLAGTGFLKAKQSVGDFMDALRDMGPLGGKAADGLGKAAGIAGKLGIAGVAAVGLFEGFRALYGYLDAKSAPVQRDIDEMAKSLARFAASGKATGELAKTFGTDMAKLGKDIAQITTARRDIDDLNKAMHEAGAGGNLGQARYAGFQGQKAQDSIRQQTSDIHALDQALAKLVTGGNATQAKVFFDQMLVTLFNQGKTLPEVNAMFSEYSKAAGDAAAGLAPLAKGFGDVAQNANTMNRGLKDAIEHGQSLTDVFKQLNGAALDLLGANINVKQDLDDLAHKFAKGKDAINDNTQAGRDNLKMIAATIQDAAQAAQAKYQESGSVEQATQTYNGYIAQLRQVLLHAGLTKQQVDALLAAYAQMPPAVTTVISTPGLTGAVNSIERFKQTLTDINGRNYTATVTYITHGDTTHAAGGPSFRRWGGITEHAQEGLLRSAGMYSSMAPARYAFAEPATGGEAFVPRFGDYSRSTAILDRASRWYGGQFMPGGTAAAPQPMASTPAPTVNLSARVFVGDRELLDVIRVEVDQHDRRTAAAVSGGVRY